MSTYLNGQKAFESIVYARLIAYDGSRSYIEVPRVTTTQRDALQVRPGTIVYNTDAATLQVRTATGWEGVGLGSSWVISVNGKTGAVELVPGDIGAAEVGHTHVVGDVAGLQAVSLPDGTFGDTLFHNGTGWGVENTGPLTSPKRTLVLQGASLIVPDTNGAEIVTETLAGGRLIRGASFGASASDITAQIGHPMPTNWDGGTVTAQFLFATAATTGTVTFSLAGQASISDDGLDQAFGTPQSATLDIAAQPGKAAWDLWTTDPTNPITLAGSPQGPGRRWVQWRITRDAADTCAEDVLLLAVVIEYGTDGYSDA